MTHIGKGLQTHRFKDNPEEKRFAVAWEKQNIHGKILPHLLDTRPVHQGFPPEPSDRDYTVAATVVQWLGSPVGQSWLKELGYEKTEPPKPKRYKSPKNDILFKLRTGTR